MYQILIKKASDEQLSKRKRMLHAISKIMRIVTSRNKPAAIEQAMISSAVHELTKMSSFNNELEKIAVSADLVWSKIKPIRKAILNFKKPGAEQVFKGMVNSGDKIRGLNYINSSIGKPLIRSVPYKQWDYKSTLIEKNTYRKPGASTILQ
jgi:hypothetical protein